MGTAIQDVNAAAQSVMDQAAIVASLNSSIVQQQMSPPEPMLYPYRFDQQATCAILKYQYVQAEERTTETEFNRLLGEWRSGRRATSSSTVLAMHPSYQEIIGMGEKVLPYIFSDLLKGVDHWFWALRAITHKNPVSPEIRGNMEKMANAWLNWGRENGYIPN